MKASEKLDYKNIYNKWWHRATIYEIYPKSFNTTFKGITAKLDYLVSLGIDALWLCPIFLSPFVDSGYDVADYYKVNPSFGTMEEFESLLMEAHDRGLKVILDMVLNHTSDLHPWFQSAQKDQKSDYRDYYIFGQGKEDQPPNNWISSKTLQSVWTYNDRTEDYYFHAYTKHQPDLNWDNPRLRDALYQVLRFWLEKGVDGFRLDVINKIAKAKGFKDYTPSINNPYADAMYENQPQVHEYLREMNDKVFTQYPDAVTMGQTAGVTYEQACGYCHYNQKALNLYLQFEHMDLDKGCAGAQKPYTTKALLKALLPWQQLAEDGVWPTVFFGSHDAPRMVNHYGANNERYSDKSAKMLFGFQMCLLGTQVVYMGDELGLRNKCFESIEAFEDIRSHDIYEARIASGSRVEEVLQDLNRTARDHARYPMPWDLAETQKNKKNSVLSFYKAMIAYRKESEVLRYGKVESVTTKECDMIVVSRAYKRKKILMIANRSDRVLAYSLEGLCSGDIKDYELVVSNENPLDPGVLSPFEIRIYESTE